MNPRPLREWVVIGRELIGVPADEFVTLVGVHGTERVRIDGDGHFVKHGVTSEGGVVGFQVQLDLYIPGKL